MFNECFSKNLYIKHDYGVIINIKDDVVTKFVACEVYKIDSNIENIINSLVDYKTTLQEKLQAVGKKARYDAREIKTDSSLLFEVSLIVDNKILATHVAMSKKIAEQACAKQILDEKGGKNIEF